MYNYGINGTMQQIQNSLPWLDKIDSNVVMVSFGEKPSESTGSIISVGITVIQYNEQFSKVLKAEMGYWE
jgi:hypothetical protein